MKNSEIVALEEIALNEKIDETRNDIFRARFSDTFGGSTDTSTARKLRRQLARLLTEQRKRQASQEEA